MISARRLGAKNGNFSIRPIAAAGSPPYAWLSTSQPTDRLATQVLTICLYQVLRSRHGTEAVLRDHPHHSSDGNRSTADRLFAKGGKGRKDWLEPSERHSRWSNSGNDPLVQPSLLQPRAPAARRRQYCPPTSILPSRPAAAAVPTPARLFGRPGGAATCYGDGFHDSSILTGWSQHDKAPRSPRSVRPPFEDLRAKN